MHPFGWNLTSGGDTPTEISQLVRNKISEKRKGIVFTNETLRKMSESAKRRYQTNPHPTKGKPSKMKGIPRSEEVKKKISIANTGKRHSEETKKLLSEKSKEYFKTHESPNKGKPLSEERRKHLAEVNKGRKQSRETIEKRIESNKGKLNKPVIQYSLQGDFIAEYSSCNLASQQTGIKSGIGSCANLKRPYAGGYVWRFKTEDYPLHIDTSYIDEFLQQKHERISQSVKGRTLSEETKKKISESHKGKIRTEEHRKNLSNALKGKYRGQPVEPKTHRNHSEGAKAYWDTVSEEQRKERSEKAKQTRLKNGGYNIIRPKRAILQYSLDDEFVKEWESASDVQKSLGIKSTNIIACCKGKYRQAKGFKWRYKDENIVQS